MAQNGTLVELKDVSKYYGRGERRFLAVDRVSLNIRPGEFVALLGPSGCGKSTLLRIITGLAQPSEGQVLYRNQPLHGVNPHATIVFQTFALYPWLTVQANVEVALKARGVPPEEREEQAVQLIDLVGMDGFEGAYPRELSGGMRQKVGFARALAVKPELLCLDEPFSALDVLSAEALRGELLELWISKAIPTQAILMVTHNIEEAVFMADRIIVMDKDPGRVIAMSTVGLRHPRHRKSAAFQAMVDKVYAAVAGKTEPETEVLGSAPGEPGRTVKLPPARINSLAGLMEKVSEEGGRHDLYRVSEELTLELDDLLPVVEAAELLGFAQVDQGDIVLTPLGQAFAEGSILTRKELVAGRILRQPTVRWIYETLQADPDGRLAWEYFLDRLSEDFGDLAEQQLDTAINWGRYAELFAYDDDSGELYIEPEEAASLPAR
jgi:NitT/TauT family transport system ATP-binding protein